MDIRTPDDMRYQIAGMIVNSWAMLDQCTDLMLIKVYWRLGGDQWINKIPWELGKKLALLKDAADRTDALAEHRDQINIMCDEAAKLHESRHTIVHGFSSQLNSLNVRYDRWKIEKNKLLHGSTVISLQELLNFSIQSKVIASRFHDMEVLFSARWPVPPEASVSSHYG